MNQRTGKMLLWVFVALWMGTLCWTAPALADEVTVQGIVQLEDGVLVLDSEEGSFVIEGIDLSPYVGKQVEVTGTLEERENVTVLKAMDFAPVE